MTAAVQISSPMELAQRRRAALWGAQGVIGQLAKQEAHISACLPAGVDTQRWLGSLFNAIKRTPALKGCTPDSVLAGAFECAHLGLTLGGPLQQAWLIPYGKEAQLQLGYRGLIWLAMEAGIVASISGEVVYEADEIDFAQGTEPYLRHKPSPLPKAERGDAVWVYSVATHTDGRVSFRIIPVWEADRHAKNTPAWKNHRDEMRIKHVMKKHLKRMRLTPTTARAVELDHKLEMGERQQIALPDAFGLDLAEMERGILGDEHLILEAEVHTNDCHPDAEPPEDT